MYSNHVNLMRVMFACMYTHTHTHTCTHSYIYTCTHCRALMRMLEGLHSQDAALRGFTISWVKSRLQKPDLDRLLHPLLRILQEADTKRAMFEAASPKVEQHSKYFYASLSKDKNSGGTDDAKEHPGGPTLVYTQVYDTSQVLFALSVLQSTMTVDRPAALVARLGESVVDLRSYRAGSPLRCVGGPLVGRQQQQQQEVGPKGLGTREHAAQRKSLLEFVLSTCVVYLQSEYPLSGEVPLGELVANVKVKLAAAELITTVLHEFVGILRKAGEEEVVVVGGGGPSERGERVGNPSYVSALVTLCDVQKAGLLQLASTLRSLKEGCVVGSAHQTGAPKGAGGDVATGRLSVPSSVLEPYYVQLLKLVQQLVVLDTLCVPGSSLPPPPPSPSSSAPPQNQRSDSCPAIIPAYPTAAQPLFQSLLLDAVQDLSLLPLHWHTLDMVASLLPHVPVLLEDLVPRLIAQVCTNLGLLLRSGGVDGYVGEMEEEVWKAPECCPRNGTGPQLSGEVVVAYLRSVTSLVHFCILGVRIEDSHSCSHQELSVFRDLVPVCDAVSVSSAMTPTSLQPSTMSWLFGIFSGGQKGLEQGGGEEQQSKAGLRGAGQTVLVLLSRVYTVLADLWAHFRRSGDPGPAGTHEDSVVVKKCRVEFEVMTG